LRDFFDLYGQTFLDGWLGNFTIRIKPRQKSPNRMNISGEFDKKKARRTGPETTKI